MARWSYLTRHVQTLLLAVGDEDDLADEFVNDDQVIEDDKVIEDRTKDDRVIEDRTGTNPKATSIQVTGGSNYSQSSFEKRTETYGPEQGDGGHGSETGSY